MIAPNGDARAAADDGIGDMTSDVIAIVAYIDPGMGSLLMQSLLAGIVGVALFLGPNG